MLDLDGSLSAVEELKRIGPDILLVDSVNATTDFDVLSRTRALLPEIRVLLLADEPDEDYQVQAIRLGARGFVSRSCAPEVFERALKHVAKGEIWIDHGLASRIIGNLLQSDSNHNSGEPELSRRELEVLSLLSDGYRNKEIASVLSLSDNTVRAHVSSLYRKIHATSRVEAALYYFAKVRKNGSPGPPVHLSSREREADDSSATLLVPQEEPQARAS